MIIFKFGMLQLIQVKIIWSRWNKSPYRAVWKVNNKFISHLTLAQSTPSAAATVQVSHALPVARFSCLQRDEFPRWRRSRKRRSVCSVLKCPDLWLQCSVSFMHGLEKTHLGGASFLNCAWNLGCTVITDLDTSKRSTQKKPFTAAAPSWKLAPRPRSKHEKRAAGSAWETWTVAAADGVRCDRVRWEIHFC